MKLRWEVDDPRSLFGVQLTEARGARIGSAAGEQLIGRDAEAEQIRAGIRSALLQALGRPVHRRAGRLPRRERQPDQAEVEQPARPLRQHGVARLDVKVQPSVAVDVAEGLGHLRHRTPHAPDVAPGHRRVELLSPRRTPS